MSINLAECREFARVTLAAPPKKAHIVRVAPVGELVARFILPLEVVKLSNPTRVAQKWMHAKAKQSAMTIMSAQFRERREAPLPGRPFVRCIRFSSNEPDKYADGFKVAVDRLVDLKLIKDDRPSLCDLHQWWEYAPPKKGFGLIEVFTGAT